MEGNRRVIVNRRMPERRAIKTRRAIKKPGDESPGFQNWL
jgi:hypothetical protein